MSYLIDVEDPLNKIAREIHKLNDKWWRDPITGERKSRNTAELLMLIVSEISEAMEGDRKNLKDDHLPNRDMFEVEIADALIRIFDLAGAHKLDLDGAVREKLIYNQTRKDHTYEARLGENGKKY